MFWALHSTFKLKYLDCDRLLIQKVPFVSIKFNDDVFFEFFKIENPEGHFGQMQGMDKKYDGVR